MNASSGAAKSKVLDSRFETGWISFKNPKPTQWWILKLDCNHIVGRYCEKKQEEAPKVVKCEYCNKNEDTIMKHYDYTSDDEGWGRNSDTGLPKHNKEIR